MADFEIPAKIQAVLDGAAALGLEVQFKADDRATAYSTIHTWTVSSPLPHDLDAVFIYWSPGARGGTVRYVVYRPYARNKRSVTRKTSRAGARSWLTILGDAVARNRA